MSNKVNQHVILKVDQHRRSCTRHRHQRGQMCCELWCTTVHQGIHSQVSCPTFSDTIRFTMNVCLHLHCGLSVFRIGRTARAGKAGLAFTFLLGVQVKHIYIITHWWERQMIRINSGPNKMFLCHPQEKNFLQMVVEAGSPGIQKQIVKPENLKGMEARYEQTLQELANTIKVQSQTHSVNIELDSILTEWKQLFFNK